MRLYCSCSSAKWTLSLLLEQFASSVVVRGWVMWALACQLQPINDGTDNRTCRAYLPSTSGRRAMSHDKNFLPEFCCTSAASPIHHFASPSNSLNSLDHCHRLYFRLQLIISFK